jgi:hypothetical protein
MLLERPDIGAEEVVAIWSALSDRIFSSYGSPHRLRKVQAKIQVSSEPY